MLLEHVVQKFAGGTLAIQHEDWERLQLVQCNRVVFHRKIGLIGDEYIVEFAQHMDILRSTEPGVWIVRQNKIDLTVVQKPRTPAEAIIKVKDAFFPVASLQESSACEIRLKMAPDNSGRSYRLRQCGADRRLSC